MTEDREKADMKTDVSIFNIINDPVLAGQFKSSNKDALSLSAHQIFRPVVSNVVRFKRFVSESELSGSSITYAIKTNISENKTLLDGYGSFDELNAGKEGNTIDGYGPFGELSFTGFMQIVKIINNQSKTQWNDTM